MKNRIGEIYNNLTIISFDKKQGKRYYWNCKCECGSIKSIIYDHLKSENTKSCGCIRKENTSKIGKANKTHGYSKLKQFSEYNSWQTMIQRCYNKNHDNYLIYGAKNITVCERWLNSFENFIEDMGNRPNKNYTIDRINNKGNYEPSNCRWSSKEEQNNNQSTNKQVINIITNEKYTSISKAAKSMGINHHTLRDYLNGKCKNKTNLKLINK